MWKLVVEQRLYVTLQLCSCAVTQATAKTIAAPKPQIAYYVVNFVVMRACARARVGNRRFIWARDWAEVERRPGYEQNANHRRRHHHHQRQCLLQNQLVYIFIRFHAPSWRAVKYSVINAARD